MPGRPSAHATVTQSRLPASSGSCGPSRCATTCTPTVWASTVTSMTSDAAARKAQTVVQTASLEPSQSIDAAVTPTISVSPVPSGRNITNGKKRIGCTKHGTRRVWCAVISISRMTQMRVHTQCRGTRRCDSENGCGCLPGA